MYKIVEQHLFNSGKSVMVSTFQTLAMLLSLFLLFNNLAFSQDLEFRDRGNRSEGVKAFGISAPDLELLSFLRYKEKVEPKTNVILKIRFYLQKATFFYITAKELKVRRFYLMKSNINNWPRGWQEFAPWPTNGVLRPLELLLDDLGIVGRLQHDRIGSGEITPLIVYHSQFPTELMRYMFDFVSKKDLQRIEYKLYKLSQEEPIVNKKIRGLFGGIPFSISIDMSNYGEGYYKLVLDGKFRNEFGGPHRSYTFYHHPRVEHLEIK